ncbi:tyrosine-type recombinase/integrase [Duganella sp. FT50W]|uniref:Tyrosine-type recombinase/integrase n=2 Tax=Duganella TaxID=75654 RepID=A0ABW9WE88_9BURK|nr:MULTISPECIES: site-specific integrase [Duganella]MYM84116.1 tyrosine-type recombinase/integrase [Duganella lactea]MYN39171.1 tyrosine-type recombinase/integrase [Duganella margarita]
MTSEKKAPVLSVQEFRQVVAASRTHDNANRNVALLYFSVALGLRAKELSQLKLQDVLAPNGTIKDEVLLTRSTTKGRKQRLIYLTNKDVRKALTAYLKERGQNGTSLNPGAPLFKSRKGSGFSPNTMQMLFKRMYIWAGLDQASSHSGRRTFATSLIEHGADIKAVSTLMGHASVAMTARYIEDNPVRLRRMCEDVQLGI